MQGLALALRVPSVHSAARRRRIRCRRRTRSTTRISDPPRRQPIHLASRGGSCRRTFAVRTPQPLRAARQGSRRDGARRGQGRQPGPSRNRRRPFRQRSPCARHPPAWRQAGAAAHRHCLGRQRPRRARCQRCSDVPALCGSGRRRDDLRREGSFENGAGRRPRHLSRQAWRQGSQARNTDRKARRCLRHAYACLSRKKTSK